MNVGRRILDGVIVLELSGRMTGLDTPGQMKEQVGAALASGYRQVVLNLSKLSFVDSSFIGELVACRMAVARAGGSLKIACPVRRVQEILFITNLGSIIESFASEAAAIDSFGKPAN